VLLSDHNFKSDSELPLTKLIIGFSALGLLDCAFIEHSKNTESATAINKKNLLI